MENLIKKINDLREKVVKTKEVLGIERKKVQLNELNFLMAKDDFWKNNDQAVKVSQEAEFFKTEIDRFENLEKEIRNLEELAVLSGENEGDNIYNDIEIKLIDLEKEFEKLEFFLLFSGKDDDKGAILSIHAGSGGVDAQDWAEILERMYLRYFEKKGFQVEILDRVPANEAGIKNSILKVNGLYVYGNLRSENGVHRLVRISPFDSEDLRHTSFAGVEVIPQIEDDGAIKIEEKDIRIDVYKSSGPGGQGVNTTDSAVRIVHLPTNVSVSCQSERSQHQNKEKAFQILRAKLYQLQEEKNQADLQKIKGSAGQGTWGKQIRSYVFQPYQMVKDHRTGFSSNKLDEVINGDLDEFIESYLKYLLKNKNN
ncbi:MAG: peptide chain release factor 2 [Patescibacteria group bacterium]